MEKEIGIPHTIGFLNNFERLKDNTIVNALTALLIVKYFKRFISNCILIFCCENTQQVVILKAAHTNYQLKLF